MITITFLFCLCRAFWKSSLIKCQTCFALVERNLNEFSSHLVHAHDSTRSKYEALHKPNAYVPVDSDEPIMRSLSSVSCPRCGTGPYAAPFGLCLHYELDHALPAREYTVSRILKDVSGATGNYGIALCRLCSVPVALEDLDAHTASCKMTRESRVNKNRTFWCEVKAHYVRCQLCEVQVQDWDRMKAHVKLRHRDVVQKLSQRAWNKMLLE